MSLNKHMIIGNLGQNPELKYTPNGQAVCALSVATNKKWKDKAGQEQEKTSWHRVVCWGPIAESCAKYLTKGRQVYVEGEVDTREWTDKQNVKRYTTEITAHTVQFLGSPGAGGNRPPHPADGGEAPAAAAPGPAAPPAGEEEIPF